MGVARRVVLWLSAALLVGFAGAVAWFFTPDLDRATLEARHAGPPSRFEEVLGLRVHLRDTGPRDGPAVLMLHGFGASLHTWDDWAAGLEDRFRVIRLDLPGFALTGPDPSGDYTDARGVAVLAALLNALGVEGAAVVGNSLGGRLAWRLALAHPERVTRLVLVAPDGFAPPGRAYGQAEGAPPLMRLLPFALPRAMLRDTMAASYGDPSRLPADELDRAHDLMRAPGVRHAMLARMEQRVIDDPRPLLDRLEMPVLLLWGERDRMIPASHARDWLAVLPRAAHVELPGLGHVPQEEAPAASLAPVRAFLER